uniref:Adaptor related protein complex 1 associated regulatory protein n=1 Tax=Salarias fasciatus TaxID=181472 RepID=A0A672G365_SALFA
MGNCWAYCVGLFRRETSRIQRGGGSKYFRSSTTGEHYTIEFENLVESDEVRLRLPISEDEIKHLREHRYAAISDKQVLIDQKLQAEVRVQKKLRLEEEARNAAQREAARLARERKLKELSPKRSGAAVRLPSDTNVVTPNTECSWDFTTKTRSTNDDCHPRWTWSGEDEEGINRALPAWERSRTEEDILRAAGPASASEDSAALEWENDFVSTHPEDPADFEGFVNPVLDTPSEDAASDSGLRADDRDR